MANCMSAYRANCTSLGVVATVCMLFFFLGMVQQVTSHGRMLDPIMRSSLHRNQELRERLPETYPFNYDDNQLWCGGFEYQWQTQDGKCGVCGDPYGKAQDNVAGGKYATGLIVASYMEGQQVEIEVQLTAYHKGYFQFKICPNNNVAKPATQECLDAHPLQLADGSGTKYFPSEVGTQKIRVYLPRGITCTQCVMQWLYNAGNNWGTDLESGDMCVGCGAQEQFVNCADVEVKPRNGGPPSNGPPPPPRPAMTRPKPRPRPMSKLPSMPDMSKISTEDRDTPCEGHAIGQYAEQSRFESFCQRVCRVGACHRMYCACKDTSTTPHPATKAATPPPRARPISSIDRGSDVCTYPPTTRFLRQYGRQRSNQHCNSYCKRSTCPNRLCGKQCNPGSSFRQSCSYQPTRRFVQQYGQFASRHCINFCQTNPSRCPNRVCTQHCTSSPTVPKPQPPQVRPNSRTRPVQTGPVRSNGPTGPCIGRPTAQYQSYAGYDLLCRESCKSKTECPNQCICDSNPDFVRHATACTAQSINTFANVEGADQWCTRFCTQASCPYTQNCRLVCN